MTGDRKRDRDRLRPIVDRYLAVADDPRQEARKRLWADHYAMRPVPATPFSVYFEGMSSTAWSDALGPDPLTTSTTVARALEDQLVKRLWMDEHVDDDAPKWRSVIVSCPVKEDSGWGVPITYDSPAERDGARKPVPPFADGIDLARLHRRTLIPDIDAGELRRSEAIDLVEGRLTVHLRFPFLPPSTFDTLVLLRGMDRLFMDVFDRPGEIHAMSAVVADSVIDNVRMRETEGWLNVFPEDDGRYRRGPHRVRAFYPTGDAPCFADEWPYFSDQTSAGLGPEQFNAFVLPSHQRMAALCTRPTVYFHGCECLDQKMFGIMRIPSLKHFHVSPYTDLDHAIEHLRDDLIIEAHCHPGNTFFGFTDEQVEADVRDRMRKLAVRQCDLHLSDIHAINGRPERLTHWARCCRRFAGKAGPSA